MKKSILIIALTLLATACSREEQPCQENTSCFNTESVSMMDSGLVKVIAYNDCRTLKLIAYTMESNYSPQDVRCTVEFNYLWDYEVISLDGTN